MESAGVTERDPLIATTPISGSISALFAFVELQVRVPLWPAAMDAGVAFKLTVGGSFTVKVAMADAVPPGPVTVMV